MPILTKTLSCKPPDAISIHNIEDNRKEIVTGIGIKIRNALICNHPPKYKLEESVRTRRRNITHGIIHKTIATIGWEQKRTNTFEI